ncbi:hypothetical protein GUITHDRAFT_117084 [Guillardia theta CCMP2712]|uniref:O-GlcNAc transferase C-terminal domain-containing protein n=1 Tax=Guillardia theta (strain CCMP2712) TaxID=905079 RepID=L1IKM2_GUITC|nr:hypothetical protein GUITHDRAFT_117084 [Guillardia theta CCMP2712]EKX36788.1 hypothetical protein GUITHDRAFT_117084 [Guillardia theta CCMP2712]|eukprot:XP_005823768.1 hypothetical protein GUITHDRAFT_117084 [Guillardia theta CCMP2712]
MIIITTTTITIIIIITTTTTITIIVDIIVDIVVDIISIINININININKISNNVLHACPGLEDTTLFNAQTTAADMLWAGVPIVTWPSTRWVGRVSASLGEACEGGVFVADSAREYTSLALAVMRRSRKIRRRLISNKQNCEMFDGRLWRIRFERSLTTSWDVLMQSSSSKSINSRLPHIIAAS